MKKFNSKAEKKAFKMGLFAGLFGKKTKRKNKQKNITMKKTYKTNHSNGLLDDIKRYRDRNLGVLYRNGKYYDTNFIDKPVEITKDELRNLHEEYDWDGKRSDIEVADDYVRHMRSKFGVFDKNGKFLHMLSEE